MALGYSNGDVLSVIREGDIIFQETVSEQSKAIKLATHSRYTHAGIIFRFNGVLQVLEAVQPVRITNLDRFIKRGVGGHYVIKRLHDYGSSINDEVITKMKDAGRSYLGKDYDAYFEWNDERIYCTELVWKIYKKTLGIEIGKLERLGDFDLSSAHVKRLMKKRYGSAIPYDEPVISPESMFRSDQLITVCER